MASNVLYTVVGPNNEPLNNEPYSLFLPFPENMEITSLRKVRYLSQNQLKARKNNQDLVNSSKNYTKNTQY